MPTRFFSLAVLASLVVAAPRIASAQENEPQLNRTALTRDAQGGAFRVETVDRMDFQIDRHVDFVVDDAGHERVAWIDGSDRLMLAERVCE